MMEPEPYELPDGIVLTTLGEARRCGWEWLRALPNKTPRWWHPDELGYEPADSPVFARNPNPPKPLEAGQVRESTTSGTRWTLIGPDPHDEVLWWAKPGAETTAKALTRVSLLTCPVVEQEPREQNHAPLSQDEVDLAASLGMVAREQKPRRMKANEGAWSIHNVEHDEIQSCEYDPRCTPVEQEGEG